MSERPDRLAETLRALLPRARQRPSARTQRIRLDHLEEDVREVRTRVNALFFTVIAVALGDLVGRLVAP
jgi:hypothetical protein